MNRWQELQQIRHLLRALVWPGSSNNVFAEKSVLVVPVVVPKRISGMRLPAALISPLPGQVDPKKQQRPDLWNWQMAVALIQGVGGDPFWQDVLLGAHRQASDESSGKGLFELEEVVLSQLESASAEVGFKLHLQAATAPSPEGLSGLGDSVMGVYVFQATASRAREYAKPTNFVATDATGGNCDLSWNVPPDRFDRLKVVLRRAAGSTAPSSATAGTGVTLSGDLDTSVTDDPGAGTFSYALFAGYDEDGDGTVDQWSAARTQTVVVT